MSAAPLAALPAPHSFLTGCGAVASASPTDYHWDQSAAFDPEVEYSVRVQEKRGKHLHLNALHQKMIQTDVPTIGVRLVRIMEMTGVLEGRTVADKLAGIVLDSRLVDHLIPLEECSACWAAHQAEVKRHRVTDNDKPLASYEERMRTSAPMIRHEPGCEKCSVKLFIDVVNKSPVEEGLAGEIYQVTCRDIKRVPFHGSTAINLPSAVPLPVPSWADPIPICKLKRGQGLHAVLYASRRSGNLTQRSRYAPTTALGVTYRCIAELDIHEASKLSSAQKTALAASCPEGVITYDPSATSSFGLRLHNDTNPCSSCKSCSNWAGREKLPKLVSFSEDRTKSTYYMGLTNARPGPAIMQDMFAKTEQVLAQLDLDIEDAP
jgi:hypothetical protein